MDIKLNEADENKIKQNLSNNRNNLSKMNSIVQNMQRTPEMMSDNDARNAAYRTLLEDYNTCKNNQYIQRIYLETQNS